MHLVRHVSHQEYWDKWLQFKQGADYLGLTPADRHLLWRELTDDEHFHEWPVPMDHFVLDPYYVGTEVVVRKTIKQFLSDFWDPSMGYETFVFIAGLGAGKSFSAALSLLYAIYQLACLKKPARYLSGFEGAGQLSGDAEIVLMNASAAGLRQAQKIVYEEVAQKVEASPFFNLYFEPYPRSSELEFPNRIRFSPGTSHWQSALGWNLYGFVVDEAAFGVESDRADYVRELFLALNQRRRSRFGRAGFGGLFTSPGSEYGFVELVAGDHDWDESILVRRTTTWEAKDELFEGQKVFLLDRDPDGVRILEEDLIYVRPGVCMTSDGQIVRFNMRSDEDRLSEIAAADMQEADV